MLIGFVVSKMLGMIFAKHLQRIHLVKINKRKSTTDLIFHCFVV